MKCTLSKLILLLAWMVTTSACGYRKFSAPDNFKALVLAFTGNDSSGTAQFALTEKTFRTLTDFNNLDGNYLTIKRGGTLSVQSVNGSLVSSENFDNGQDPKLRYEVKSGTAIALDYSTLSMLSAYYQFDEIYSTVEDKIGLNPADLQKDLSGGKHIMLFEPEIKYTGKGTDITAGIKLNAAFSPTDKKFLLFQRSPVEGVPLSSNLQVLAHEFGHFIFGHSFYGGKFTQDNRWNGEWSISGLNEGFADFMSWTYTDSSDILKASFDFDNVAVERDFIKSNFVFDDLNDPVPSACKGDFYCVGTLFARSLYQARSALKPSITKKELAQGVLSSLSKCQSAMDAMDDNLMPQKTDRSVLDFSLAFKRDGKVIGGFLRAFVLNAPTAWKGELCNAFKNNFGQNGFPTLARAGACE